MLKLLELGVEPPKAKYLTGKVMATHMEARNVADVVRLAYRMNMSTPEADATDGIQPGDLRNTAGYVDMKAEGLIDTGEW